MHKQSRVNRCIVVVEKLLSFLSCISCRHLRCNLVLCNDADLQFDFVE